MQIIAIINQFTLIKKAMLIAVTFTLPPQALPPKWECVYLPPPTQRHTLPARRYTLQRQHCAWLLS